MFLMYQQIEYNFQIKKTLGLWREEKLQVLGNTESRHHQTCGQKEKNLKRIHRQMRKLLETEFFSRNLIKVIKKGELSPW